MIFQIFANKKSIPRPLLRISQIAPFVGVVLVLVLLVPLVDSNLQSNYTQRQAQTRQKIDAAEALIDEAKRKYSETSETISTLEIKQEDIEVEDARLTEVIQVCEEAISLAEAQIVDQESKQDVLDEQKKDVLRDLQKLNTQNKLAIILTSNNLADAYSNWKTVSSLPARIKTIDERIQVTIDNIEENKAIQESCVKTSEESKALQRALLAELEVNLERQRNIQADQQAEINAAQTLRASQYAEAERLQKEYESAVAEQARRAAAEAAAAAAASNNSSGNSGGNSGNNSSGNSGGNSNNTNYVGTVGGCFFEDGGNPGLNGMFIKPTNGAVTDTFGCPSIWGRRFHDGMDIANSQRTPIVAAATGVVVRTGFEAGGYGNFVVIRHRTSTGVDVFTLYAHMFEPAWVGSGAVVAQGQQIGLMGSTGWSTGSHLHFMILSPSYATSGSVGCLYGGRGTKCYNPARFIRF